LFKEARPSTETDRRSRRWKNSMDTSSSRLTNSIW